MTSMQTLPLPAPAFEKVAAFTRELRFDDIPSEVTQTAVLLTLDLIGVLVAAEKLDASRIARTHAVKHWAPGPQAPSATLLFDGRVASVPGFCFAMATQIDNLDAHDGWQPSRGHAGAALFPALAAFAQTHHDLSGREAMVAMVIGYEVAYRASLALHATVTDYHTSGAWNALGCTAIGARLRNTDKQVLRHALGIAEYHGPRSQMMREIANPTMLHDGTGWGAPTGAYALLIAEDGFTGAPAATVEFDDAAFAWEDLGERWLTVEQYIKPYPVCRWVHAPIDAALALREEHKFAAEQIERIDVATFDYSADLNGTVPQTSPMAQYSLAWPIAAALARGRVGVDEVMVESFDDSVLQDLTARTHAVRNPEYEAAFPDQRLASVTITLKNGSVLESGTTQASGGPVPQPTPDEVISKFRRFAGSAIEAQRIAQIEQTVLGLTDESARFHSLTDLLIPASGR
jgi:2-methylcitrate dehydratase PrpD